MEGTTSKTLCIPTFFIGYGGQALDKKTPLSAFHGRTQSRRTARAEAFSATLQHAV